MAMPAVAAKALTGNIGNRTMPGENKQARHPHMAVAPKTGGGPAGPSNGPSAVKAGKTFQFANKAPSVNVKKPG